MTRMPSPQIVAEPARILLFGLWRRERECLERELGADPKVRLERAVTFAEALPLLEAGTADVLICDLAFYLFLRQQGEERALGPASLPTLALVSPGEEQRLGDWLEREPADFLLCAGNYDELLPAYVRRLLRRRDTRWEEIAAILRHEINNPLTGVLGNAELALADASALPEKTRHRLATIIQLALRLRDVVRNLEAQLEGCGNPSRRDGPAAGALRLPRPVAR